MSLHYHSFYPALRVLSVCVCRMFDEKGDQVAEDSKSKNSSEQPFDAQAGLSTPLQTKAMIIDHEMNRFGMGRYQWWVFVTYRDFQLKGFYCGILSRCVWAICGTGFWLNVSWYASLTYAAPSMQREFGYSDKEYGNIFSAFSAGLMAGAAVWGILVDITGMPGRI